ncbi:hypothetical protein ACQPYA_04245 [Micromonospora sp. CA-263727]|uniref:hypothetical protein n=1 Tax=Micromonospora sp. CA-263727 TaxID=3239967 RepID=UPI003D8AF587
MSGSGRTVVEADERSRARALDQLWRLRDEELIRAGHSTPEYIAVRVVTDPGYPKPPPPMLKHALDEEVSFMSRTVPVPVASWCDADRQIVTGLHREQLLQWLPQVVGSYATRRQMDVLDGITARTSLAFVRELLASEGFEQVCDVYGNAGPAPEPRALYDYRPMWALYDAVIEQQDATGEGVPDRVALVLCSRVDGFLATVYAVDVGGGLKVQDVRVFHTVMVLDQELCWASMGGSHSFACDEHGTRTTIQVGSIGAQPAIASGGSLRVRLAALRAFTRPVKPWYARPYITFGNSGIDLLSRVDEILTGLPDWVHDLLGPQLTTPSPPHGSKAASTVDSVCS